MFALKLLYIIIIYIYVLFYSCMIYKYVWVVWTSDETAEIKYAVQHALCFSPKSSKWSMSSSSDGWSDQLYQKVWISDPILQNSFENLRYIRASDSQLVSMSGALG